VRETCRDDEGEEMMVTQGCGGESE